MAIIDAVRSKYIELYRQKHGQIDSAYLPPSAFIDFDALSSKAWGSQPVFLIERLDAPDLFAVGYTSEESAEEAYLTVAPVSSYLGIEEITGQSYSITDDEDGLRIDRSYTRDANGRFAKTGGSGSKTTTTEKKASVEAPGRVTSKTNIAQLKAIADKHGIATPKAPHKRASWNEAIKGHAEGGQYFEKGRKSKAATKPEVKAEKKTEVKTEKATGRSNVTATEKAAVKPEAKAEKKPEEKASNINTSGKVSLSEKDDYGKVTVNGVPSLKGESYSPDQAQKLINHHTSPMKGTEGSLGKAFAHRSGKPIGSASDFEKEANKAMDDLDDGNNAIPIHKLRQSLGDRVSRTDFDKYLSELQGDDKVTLTSGSGNDDIRSNIEDTIKIRGNRRYYVTRENIPADAQS